MHKNHQRVSSAFTLVEIILVVALTLFLMTVTVQGLVNSSAQFSFNNESEKIQEILRMARSLAISGKAQPDYTDYNKNLCFDKGYDENPMSCVDGDFVTPAHYGVQFYKTVDTGDAITFFIDNHSPNPADEGRFNPYDNTVESYRKGYDIILETYKLPPSMSLILPSGNGAIYFSPVFADVSTDFSLGAYYPFFIFGISQKQGDVVRKRCSEIHILAGISEPQPGPPNPDPTICP